MNENHEVVKEIQRTPVLFVQGVEDKLVKPEGTVELYNEIACPDKEIVLIPNAEHLIFEENQFTDKDIDLVTQWIDRHVATNAADATKTDLNETNLGKK
jgi:alpha-beta hydrolase superfamily lysophospholipase